MEAVIFIGAYLLDLAIGDPRTLPHPVVIMGAVITRGERLLRRVSPTAAAERLAGAVLTVSLVTGVFLTAWLGFKALYQLNFWLGAAANLWFLSTTIAIKGLADAALTVYRYLLKGDLVEARRAVGMVVGRDTQQLTAAEVSRAAVETVAENLVDGVVAPLFYGAIGGTPLALAYKAVNTLDSMIGYKNEKHLHFGRWAAKLDDAVNYIPARITACLLLAGIFMSNRDTRSAFRIMKRDSSKHPSPNGGIPESLVAGALGIQLGGKNYYFGQANFRATMGDRTREITPDDIRVTVRLVRLASAVFVGLAVIVIIMVGVIG
ncbi:adenosylcobinamide-phosphate synthase CbiB [Metallumcola ferriviriculae]|uniref:Cobalamin biosynthesis protein CobD n=1 Tax=Metallumcola ferriviriculae TaxID=3039180 RepID=A0AAU0UNK5_9FIRM|nr:adenosylcobinamide-phosphate synthase CbiB [Desulfitibacteraceae bacterium MK1]